MKIGDVVIDKFDGLVGKVTYIKPGTDDHYLGFIFVEVIKPDKDGYGVVGSVVDYSYYNWHEVLEICE